MLAVTACRRTHARARAREENTERSRRGEAENRESWRRPSFREKCFAAVLHGLMSDRVHRALLTPVVNALLTPLVRP